MWFQGRNNVTYKKLNISAINGGKVNSYTDDFHKTQ